MNNHNKQHDAKDPVSNQPDLYAQNTNGGDGGVLPPASKRAGGAGSGDEGNRNNGGKGKGRGKGKGPGGGPRRESLRIDIGRKHTPLVHAIIDEVFEKTGDRLKPGKVLDWGLDPVKMAAKKDAYIAFSS